jgi:hypothetical protein
LFTSERGHIQGSASTGHRIPNGRRPGQGQQEGSGDPQAIEKIKTREGEAKESRIERTVVLFYGDGTEHDH